VDAELPAAAGGKGKLEAWGWEEPRWPSLMAVVERAERDVVVELGVPLEGRRVSLESRVEMVSDRRDTLPGCSGGLTAFLTASKGLM
jgi:hypothetical protein